MWPFNRRKEFRRVDDLKIAMTKAIEEKHKTAKECLEKMRQFVPERRTHSIPVNLERRRLHA